MSGGGSIQEVTLKGRRFAVAADADSNRKIGGFEAELAANGDGSGRKILTRVMGKIDGLTLDVDDDRGDQEFLQDIADDPALVPVTITYVTGYTWQGDGTITGELSYSSKNGTCGVTIETAQKLTRQ